MSFQCLWRIVAYPRKALVGGQAGGSWLLGYPPPIHLFTGGKHTREEKCLPATERTWVTDRFLKEDASRKLCMCRDDAGYAFADSGLPEWEGPALNLPTPLPVRLGYPWRCTDPLCLDRLVVLSHGTEAAPEHLIAYFQQGVNSSWQCYTLKTNWCSITANVWTVLALTGIVWRQTAWAGRGGYFLTNALCWYGIPLHSKSFSILWQDVNLDRFYMIPFLDA